MYSIIYNIIYNITNKIIHNIICNAIVLKVNVIVSKINKTTTIGNNIWAYILFFLLLTGAT